MPEGIGVIAAGFKGKKIKIEIELRIQYPGKMSFVTKSIINIISKIKCLQKDRTPGPHLKVTDTEIQLYKRYIQMKKNGRILLRKEP